MRRGDGIGLELGATIVRGVRLSADAPDRVAAVSEITVARPDDNATIVDALVRVRGQLGAIDVPTRVACFPDVSMLQRIDTTGRTGTELNELRHELAGRFDIGSTMLIDAGPRRFMIAVKWDHTAAWRLQELAERAGFLDVEVEPAPVAAQRVLPSAGGPAASGPQTGIVVRRDIEADGAWAAVYDEAGPLAAAAVPTASREHPGLAIAPATAGLHHLEEVLADAELDAELGRIVAASLPAPGDGALRELGLRVVDDDYPPYPPHDLRAPQRVVVALGAAVGAAGLAGRLMSVDVVAPTAPVPDVMPRPWAIERVRNDTPLAERATPSRFQQLRARIGSFLRR